MTESAPDPSPRAAPKSRWPPFRVLLLAGLLAASGVFCAVALARGWVRPDLIQALVRRSGPGAMAVYVGAVIALEIIWMPRMWGLVAAGALFGPVIGCALSITADLSSAVICYALARGAARAWVRSLLDARPRAARIIELLAEKRGALTIGLLRVCPVAHYTLVNYGAGIAGVRLGPFVLGTAVGLLPGAILFSLLGDSLLRPGSAMFIVTTALVVAALIATLILGRRILRAPDGRS